MSGPASSERRAEAVLAWLRIAGIAIRIEDGIPRFRFPRGFDGDSEEVLAELRDVRGELIALMGRGVRVYVPILDDPPVVGR